MSQSLSTNRVGSNYKLDNSNTVLRNYPVLGIVKNNIDPAHSGRIQVALNDMGNYDPDSSENWVTVNYMSPFYGITSGNKVNADNYGSYVDTPHSYGFWATPPDIGTMVICVFVNGDLNFGYYIGCVPQAGSNFMIPAVGAYSNIVIGSEEESKAFGQVPKLPVTELNLENPSIRSNESFVSQPHPIHSYAAATYHRQGVTRDTIRGPISSSAQRESPSRVFGISSPGRPIYQGGFTDETLATNIDNATDDQLKVVGRRGGHSFVMDDGTKDGTDQLMRFRTSNGHQIMMNDSGNTISIMHGNGKCWVELGQSGTIDVYSDDSINFRTMGDINLRADKNINIDAGESLTLKSKTTNQYTEKMNVKANDYSIQTIGKYSVKVGGDMLMSASGLGSYAAASTMYINGKKINLNTGSGPSPSDIKDPVLTSHSDTIFDGDVGFANTPEALKSIVSRAPTHLPWDNLGKGVYASPTQTAPVAPSGLKGF